ncbi:hypothetical protein FNAPI_7047 [Fusarium napiforme]|uniref:Uncharacterized protein n=1 Tax=Fusarium napiforme TaxID=42672 RepID=A0A8H5N551_9HYPO|nr:hypothetical protein FNAPI_7047 [Fusarium napiforme]
MNPQQTGLKNPGWNWGGKTVSRDEFFHRLGPEGRRDWAEKGQWMADTFGTHAAKSPAGTAYENIQQRGNIKAEKVSNDKSSQDMDNIRKIGRLMERVEVLEAENRALKKKNTEFEDEIRALKKENAKAKDRNLSLMGENIEFQEKNLFLKRKNTEFEDKQAKMAKLLTDD